MLLGTRVQFPPPSIRLAAWRSESNALSQHRRAPLPAAPLAMHRVKCTQRQPIERLFSRLRVRRYLFGLTTPCRLVARPRGTHDRNQSTAEPNTRCIPPPPLLRLHPALLRPFAVRRIHVGPPRAGERLQRRTRQHPGPPSVIPSGSYITSHTRPKRQRPRANANSSAGRTPRNSH